jgi:hypothetical protein
MRVVKTAADTERIDLLRSGSLVSSLAGAFGNALRETRLTAMLGYLVALEPERFCEIFAFRGRPLSVSLETRHADVRVGISYIASIESVEVVETWKDLLQAVREVRGKQWLNGHMALVQPLRRWGWHGTKRNLLFLSTPRLVFNPPVLKENLQKGRG